MFVRKVKKPNDHVSIRIVENKREGNKIKQRPVCSIGHCHKDDTEKVARLIRIAEKTVVNIKNDLKPALPGMEGAVHSIKKRKKTEGDIHSSHLQEEKRIQVGSEDVFSQIYHQCDLFDSIQTGKKQKENNEYLKEIVLARIRDPESKRKSVQSIKQDRDVNLNLNKVYRMMDKVYQNKKRIKNKICQKTISLLKEKVEVAFFDVTTLYFESFKPDDLRVSGFSKDNKVKETQIMLALITTSDGLPLGYELFPGNTYEGNTLIKAIDNVSQDYDIKTAFLVADRAMFTKNNLEELQKRGIKFIVAAKLRGMKQEYKGLILNDFHSDEEKSSLIKTYKYEGKRLIVNYSEKRALKEEKERIRLIERIKGKMQDGQVRLIDLVKNRGTKKYLKIDRKGQKTAGLDEQKIKQDAMWDGIHGVITNHQDLDPESVLKKYRNLWQIEEAFRVNKHDLKMRPIYHWTPRRIEAHILICYMAYGLAAFIRRQLRQAKINLSFAKIRDELKYIQASVLKDTYTGKRFLLPSSGTPQQRAIYKALHLTMKEKITPIK